MKKLIHTLLIIFLLCTTASANTDVTMTAEEKAKLDTFFSNFSEADFRTYFYTDMDDRFLVDFALTNILINSPAKLEILDDGVTALIPFDMVDRVTERYFGKTIANHPEPFYSREIASGEVYIFSQIDTLSQMENGVYEAQGTIYYADSGEVFNAHASPDVWAKEGLEIGSSSTFFAQFLQVSQDGAPRYILLEYIVMEEPEMMEGESLPVLINGDVVEVTPQSDRETISLILSQILPPESLSVSTDERIQYDFSPSDESAPVTILFDFTKDGLFQQAIFDSYTRESNPVVQDLLGWLEYNVGPGSLSENETWYYAGMVITFIEILDAGEDSVCQIHVVVE